MDDVPTITIPERPAVLRPELGAGDRVERYELIERLGAGGMGVVWAARDPELGRKVAVKLVRPLGLHPHARARLRREAQAMAMLSHPSVVQVFDVGAAGDQVFIAMELVEGETLRQALRGRHGWREVAAMFVHAGRGIAAAHGAGIVHRDFKPENVLVGRDGRVRVSDFGLARLAEPDEADAGDGADEADGAGSVAAATAPREDRGPELTGTGAVMGTPRYMSPEQHRGEPAGAASDQFSFCVAFWEGLHGEIPFRVGDLVPTAPARAAIESPAALAATEIPALASTELPDAPGRRPRGSPGALPAPLRGTSPVPRWLHRILVRGLAADPADRWPSMTALVDAVEAIPRRRRRIAIGGAAAGVLIATAIGVAAAVRSDPAGEARAMCDHAGDRIAARWTAADRAALVARVRTRGGPGAQTAAGYVGDRLDAYARELAAARIDACAATHVRGEQSPALFDGRMRCLDRRGDDLDATVALFDTVTPGDLLGLVRSVDALPELASCADPIRLSEARPLPAEPAARAAIVALGGRLAAIQASIAAGRFQPALAAGRALLADPFLDADPALACEAHLRIGWALESLVRVAEAEPELRAAVRLCEVARDDVLRADALLKLVSVVAQLKRPDEAARILEQHAAVADRIGSPERRLRGLDIAGWLATQRGDQAHGIELSIRAVEEWERRKLGDLGLADLAANVGVRMSNASRYREALVYLERAKAIFDRLLGPDHPNQGRILANIASASMTTAGPAAALQKYERAFAIFEAAGLGDKEDGLTMLANIAATMSMLGRVDDAEHRLVDLIGRIERLQGADAKALGSPLFNLGNNRLLAGQPARAEPWFRKALDHAVRVHGERNLKTANARWGLAAALLDLDRAREAIPLLEAALPIQRAEAGLGSDDLSFTQVALARGYLAVGQPARALEQAAACQAYFDAYQDPGDRGLARLVLARALHGLGREPARVIELARKARVDLAAAKKATDVAEADRLLAGAR